MAAPLIDAQDIAALKSEVLAAVLSVSQLDFHCWGVGFHLPVEDKRGGAKWREFGWRRRNIGGQSAAQWQSAPETGSDSKGLQRAQADGKKCRGGSDRARGRCGNRTSGEVGAMS